MLKTWPKHNVIYHHKRWVCCAIQNVDSSTRLPLSNRSISEIWHLSINPRMTGNPTHYYFPCKISEKLRSIDGAHRRHSTSNTHDDMTTANWFSRRQRAREHSCRGSPPCWCGNAWITWKALNRLRTQVGRSRANMHRWGYSNDPQNCDGGVRWTIHFIVCELMDNACHAFGLTKANDITIKSVMYWEQIT